MMALPDLGYRGNADLRERDMKYTLFHVLEESEEDCC